jgi:preprotein translocase subunit SecA
VSAKKSATPGVIFGSYPEKKPAHNSWSSSFKLSLQALLLPFESTSSKPYEPFVKQVASYESAFIHLSEARLKTRLRELRSELSMHGQTDELIAELFAIIKQTCARELSVRPYDTQIIAARIMLDGKLAEMATGEGKTLAAAICVASAALVGIPVHLITSNDYLVTRDSASLRPLYQALGLTVGAVTNSLNAAERKLAYACDITYVTAKELVFDYLRDHIIGGITSSELHHHVAKISGQTNDRLLRGLSLAIIDEADSILIDEARVPLIISQSVLQQDQLQYHETAMNIVSSLILGQDFTLDQKHFSVNLTDHGHLQIETFSQSLGNLWLNRMYREETICQALAAQHLYHCDRHYLVRDDSVHIIDEITGRTAPGRVWSRGLHQMIELKEDCKPSGEMVTTTQITYQRFFQKYLQLGGMSGTISESRTELFAVYGLKIAKVPLRKPSLRINLPSQIYPNQQTLWKVVAEKVKTISQSGRPVLIGTDSVADSESLSKILNAHALTHEVLNARQDQREATIIAQAGQPKQITVSTNIAGRGTDISLGKGVAELGGIHIINCQHNLSRRIDRQLLGRCARQGNAGSTETLLSLENHLITHTFPTWIKLFVGEAGLSKPRSLVMLIIRLPQWLEESRHRTQRLEMMKRDAQLAQQTSTQD